MNDGVIDQIGSPEELYDNPENEFVARFLGKGNVFRGSVVSVEGQTCIAQIGSQQIGIGCNASLGKEIVFSVKPEDVSVSLTMTPNALAAELVSVVPQIGEHRVVMQLADSTITALVNDDSLIESLQKDTVQTVYFSFNPRAVSLVSDSSDSP
jgi:ABC-type Fe3+/spermidine/putrescine transport system ATPase subunit